MKQDISLDDFRELELNSCSAVAPTAEGLNLQCSLPYGLRAQDVFKAMSGFAEFLSFVNVQLNGKGTERLETMLMSANFSSMVGEYMSSNIPRYCKSVVKNRYHNGHPDIIPANKYPGNAAQHVSEGIEVKASRSRGNWQGHNPEELWLLMFVFESGRPSDEQKMILPAPFRFRAVYCARLEQDDWKFAGRGDKSRRTITAAVTRTGKQKLIANWVYQDPELLKPQAPKKRYKR